MRLAFEIPVPAPRELVFSFFEGPGNLAVLMRGWRGFRVLSAPKRVRKGRVVRVRVRFGPLRFRIAFRHGPHRPPRHMGERAFEGPFSRFVHHHRFEERGETTIVRDALDLRLPLRFGGEAAMRLLVAPYVRRMFAFRARRLSELAAAWGRDGSAGTMNRSESACAVSGGVAMAKSTTVLVALAFGFGGWAPAGPEPPGVELARQEARLALTGRVVEAKSGKPVPGASVQYLIPRIPYSWMLSGGESVKTDDEGRFRLPLEAPGTYLLWVHLWEYENHAPGKPGLVVKGAPAWGQVFRTVEWSGDPSNVSEALHFEMRPPATLEIVARDETGAPLGHAAVVAMPENAQHPSLLLGTQFETGDAGSARVPGLGGGPHRILVFKKGVGTEVVRNVALRPGEKQFLEARVPKGGDLYLGARGTPLLDADEEDGWSMAMWELRDEDGGLVSLGPLSAWLWGIPTLDDLPRHPQDRRLVFGGTYKPGRYRVVVHHPRQGSGSIHAFLHEYAEGVAEVIVEAGGETKVVVDVREER